MWHNPVCARFRVVFVTGVDMVEGGYLVIDLVFQFGLSLEYSLWGVWNLFSIFLTLIWYKNNN